MSETREIVDTFKDTDSKFCEQMAAGHLMRCGHKLEGYYVSAGEGIVELVRTCCETS